MLRSFHSAAGKVGWAFRSTINFGLPGLYGPRLRLTRPAAPLLGDALREVMWPMCRPFRFQSRCIAPGDEKELAGIITPDGHLGYTGDRQLKRITTSFSLCNSSCDSSTNSPQRFELNRTRFDGNGSPVSRRRVSSFNLLSTILNRSSSAQLQSVLFRSHTRNILVTPLKIICFASRRSLASPAPMVRLSALLWLELKNREPCAPVCRGAGLLLLLATFFRYDVRTVDDTGLVIVRHDRWTGIIERCIVSHGCSAF